VGDVTGICGVSKWARSGNVNGGDGTVGLRRVNANRRVLDWEDVKVVTDT